MARHRIGSRPELGRYVHAEGRFAFAAEGESKRGPRRPGPVGDTGRPALAPVGGVQHHGGIGASAWRFLHRFAISSRRHEFVSVGNGTFRIINVRWDDEYLGDSLQGDGG